jgi:hypothetical protein
MDKRALEYASFIDKIIQLESIPAPHGEKGGAVLMGWSLGNMYAIDFLNRCSTLPWELTTVMSTYVRAYIFYGLLILLNNIFEFLIYMSRSVTRCCWYRQRAYYWIGICPIARCAGHRGRTPTGASPRRLDYRMV